MMTSFRNLFALLAVVLATALTPAVAMGQDALTPALDDAAKMAEADKLVAVLQSDAVQFDKA
ncbi:MAG: hypothetical protein U1E05_14065 [Patescibacteria group bacterium]|nr:hypothetical protein [Patescibacteria group bacterium]